MAIIQNWQYIVLAIILAFATIELVVRLAKGSENDRIQQALDKDDERSSKTAALAMPK